MSAELNHLYTNDILCRKLNPHYVEKCFYSHIGTL